jgi:CHAT domain-containing protein
MSLSSLHIKDQPGNIIDLKILHEPHSQEFSLFFEEKRKGEEGPLQSYIRTKISTPKLRSISNEIYSFLYSSTHSSEYDRRDITKRLQQAGLDLYNSIFPLQIKEKLATACSKNLCLTINDSLLNIPWELIYDGEAFFCLRFNMGRRVYTSHPAVSYKIRDLQRIKMLILADPKNDLPKSYDEGVLLHKKLENWGDLLDVNLLTTSIDLKMISRQIFEYHILHYAGHALYNRDNPDLSGWVLDDGLLTARRIMELAGCKKPLPVLIFSNACQSGQTSEWSKTDQKDWGPYYAYDLVNAFLRSGVQHYIGTFQDIGDLSGLSLALDFYKFMAQSCSIGEALRKARIQFINGWKEYGKNNLIWAYYMLYGDPTTCYFKQIQTQKEDRKRRYVRGIKGKNDSDGLLVCASGDIEGKARAKVSSGNTLAQAEEKILEPADKKNQKKAQGIHLSKKLSKRITLGVIAGMVFFLFFIKLQDRLTMENKGTYKKYTDLEWEEKKWDIVERIMDKMRQRYRFVDPYPIKDVPPAASPSVSHDQYTLCIIPSNPVKKDKDAELLVEELITFFNKQPKYVVVERERLDFVIRELELKTLNLSEDKLHFSLGEIFDAREIIFVKVFEHPGRFPHLTRKKEAFLRLVETKTTAIKARAAEYFDPHDIKGAGRFLGEQLISSLEKKIVKNKDKDGQRQ